MKAISFIYTIAFRVAYFVYSEFFKNIALVN